MFSLFRFTERIFRKEDSLLIRALYAVDPAGACIQLGRILAAVTSTHEELGLLEVALPIHRTPHGLRVVESDPLTFRDRYGCSDHHLTLFSERFGRVRYAVVLNQASSSIDSL